MKPANVIFDMDDVLCRYDLGQRLRVLSRLTGLMARDIRAAIWDSGFEDEADTGGYSDPESYLMEFGRRLGYPLTRAEWVAARRQAMQCWPDMLSLASTIGKQARIAIFSNNGPLTKAALSEIAPDISAIFDEHYHSFEFGSKKPDPAVYARLMDRMGVNPEECLFIDDKHSNIDGARIAGLSGHHFRSHAQLLPELQTLGFSL